nr:iap-2 [Helicoverpa armigera nucleopolyhedrovirus]
MDCVIKADLAPPYHFLDNRLITFYHVNLSRDLCQKLAKAGIYYNVKTSTYCCNFCTFTMLKVDMRSIRSHSFSLCPRSLHLLRQSEYLRRDSFRQYKKAKSYFKNSLDLLAQNGFYYFGVKTEVRCAYCLLVIVKFNFNDNLADIHRINSIDCIFVNDHDQSIPSAPTLIDIDKSNYSEEDGNDRNDLVVINKNNTNEDDSLCKICFDQSRQVCFMPCRHVMTCKICAARCKRCCLCRAKIVERFEVYLQ